MSTTNCPESPEGSAHTNCPHCGAKADESWSPDYDCGTFIRTGNRSALCIERAARQRAEAERNALKKMLDREEREHSVTVKQRDDAETAAARLAEVILGVDELNGDKHVWWARAVDRYNEIEQQLTASLAEAEKQLSDTRRKLEEAIRCLDAACVVQTNTTNRRQWVTYSGWLSPGDSLCEVALPPKHSEAKGGEPHVIHGQTCEKVTHKGFGYMHSASDDGPYFVDGARYCGRCHMVLYRADCATQANEGK